MNRYKEHWIQNFLQQYDICILFSRCKKLVQQRQELVSQVSSCPLRRYLWCGAHQTRCHQPEEHLQTCNINQNCCESIGDHKAIPSFLWEIPPGNDLWIVVLVRIVVLIGFSCISFWEIVAGFSLSASPPLIFSAINCKPWSRRYSMRTSFWTI